MSNTQDTTSEQEVLQFSAAGRLFCVELKSTMHIIPLVALQTIPGTPAYFKGLLNFHGENVFILDLASCLHLAPTSDYSIDTPIILCERESRKLGLLVDKVFGIEKSDAIETEIAPFSNHRIKTLLSGTVNTTKGPSLLLNLNPLFDSELIAAEENSPHG